MKKTVTTKKTEKAISDESEKLMIIAKADQVKGEQLVITTEGIKPENELKKFALGHSDNPEQKYDLYYKGIMRLLRRALPKGKANAQARGFIYEEKNTLLTRGKRINDIGIRGADSRMGYVDDIEELLSIVITWITSNGTMVELFNTLRELNVSKGYGNPTNK